MADDSVLTLTLTFTPSQLMSYAIAPLVGTSVFLAGRKTSVRLRTIGWAIGMFTSLCYVAYAFASRDWGWIIMPICTGPWFTLNFVQHLKDLRIERDVRAAADSQLTPTDVALVPAGGR